MFLLVDFMTSFLPVWQRPFMIDTNEHGHPIHCMYPWPLCEKRLIWFLSLKIEFINKENRIHCGLFNNIILYFGNHTSQFCQNVLVKESAFLKSLFVPIQCIDCSSRHVLMSLGSQGCYDKLECIVLMKIKIMMLNGDLFKCLTAP